MMSERRHQGTRTNHEITRTVLAVLAVAVVCGATLPGCSSTDYRDVRITSDYDDNTDFALIRTWAWLPKSPASIQDPRVHDETAHARLRRVIEAELTARGLTRTTDGKPDIWVHHTVWLMARGDLPKVDIRPATREAGAKQQADDEGGLLIEFLDGRDRRRIWAAQVRAFMNLEVTPEQKETRVRDVVRQMLDNFPPKEWRDAIKAR